MDILLHKWVLENSSNGEKLQSYSPQLAKLGQILLLFLFFFAFLT